MKLTTIVLAVLFTAISAGAHPHATKRDAAARKGTRARIAAERLDLTEAQREQIRAIRQRDREQVRSLRDEMGELAVEYRRLRERRDPRAEEMRRQLQSMKEEISILRLATRAETASVLTPEQRQRLEGMRTGRRDRRR